MPARASATNAATSSPCPAALPADISESDRYERVVGTEVQRGRRSAKPPSRAQGAAAREAPPGLIKALGHEPVRFEDFSAQKYPSREACLRGVESSDAYILLLGPHYGTVFPETEQSATHDEWVAAQNLGLPRYVLRKDGVALDPEQQKFERTLGDYGSGRFYKSFTDVASAQLAVAGVIHDLKQTPDVLEFGPLSETPDVRWLSDGAESRGAFSSGRPLLEVHVLPVDGKRASARVLEQILDGLPNRVRNARLVNTTDALKADHIADGVQLDVPSPQEGRWGDSFPGSLASVRVLADGQIAIAFRLPHDSMGSIVDVDDLAIQMASALRLAGQMDPAGATRVAVGVGLTARTMLSVAKVGQPSRNSASISSGNEPVHVEPDETMSRSALDRGAGEVAATLARTIIRGFTSSQW